MKLQKVTGNIWAAILVGVLMTAPAIALDLAEAKSAGLVGETSSGYLGAVESSGDVDALVNNAGIGMRTIRETYMNQPVRFWEDEPERWQVMIDVNLKAALATVDAALPYMLDRRTGQIALISSLSAYYGLPVTPTYCATKAGLKAYGEALRGWLKPRGIEISVVLPGFVETAMSDRFPAPKPFMQSPERAAQIIAKQLARGRARISFPFPLNFGMWSLSVLPPSWSEHILRTLRYGD